MGFDGYAYCGAAGATASNEMKHVQNLKIGITFGEVDATIQGTHGIKAYAKGLKDVVLGFDLVVFDTPDEADTVILNAIANRTPISLHFIEKESGTGPKGTFYIFGGERSMSGESLQTLPCTAKPATGYDAPTVSAVVE